MSVVLCVLLWPHPGADDALVQYEDRVLVLVAEHGGRVVQRARGDGLDGAPLEVHTLEFPSREALDSYMSDGRRTALAAERERAVARTDVFEVRLVDPSSA